MSSSNFSHSQSTPDRISILGTGSYTPERVLTNADLEAIVDTSDEWIQTRTGIRERRIASSEEATSDLASQAAQQALKSAGVSAEEIDLIIVATVSPDMFFPSTACFVQSKIGATNAIAFDISAACSGFLYAYQTARNFLKSGTHRTALVIGAEKLSTFINWKDRNTCVLFGDGAGAIVIQRRDDLPEDASIPGQVLSSVIGTDGSLANILKIPGGGSFCPITVENVADRPNTIYMEGRETFKHAVTRMKAACEHVLAEAGYTGDDIKLLIAHQANSRIITAIAEKLDLASEKVFINLDRYGNTSAASIPLALDEANRTGKLQKGDLVLFVAFGGGLTWASTLIRW